MKQLLLPFAYDSTGQLVHIDDARKNEKYTCPTCGNELKLRISHIPKGEKYHRTNHFAHKNSEDNHCSESFLHKLFKNKLIDYINGKIASGEKIEFKWKCEKCGEQHEGNLLKKAIKAVPEYNMQTCRPDIALLDKDNKVVIVIEVVVTHEPEKDTINYYDDHKIACLQINVESFDDCDIVVDKLSRPYKVNLCPNPICKECGRIKNRKILNIHKGSCWSCEKEMKIAIIDQNDFGFDYGLEYLTENDINKANKEGAHIEKRLSKTTKEEYYANICTHCNSMIGNRFLHNYYDEPIIKQIDLEYECYHCIEDKRIAEIEARKLQERKIDEIIYKNGTKICPKCGRNLRVRKSENGYFYGCESYPNCKYTENIHI